MISWKLKNSGHRPIGLDVGHSSVKMIQLAANGGNIAVLAADKVYIDPDIDGDIQRRRSFIVSAIKQMLANGSFSGRNVVSCLPNDSLKITSLRLAETEIDDIEQALKKEAAQRFGLDPDKDVINYILAGNIRQGDEIKNELILIAADNDTIKQHIEMLEQAQLRPVAIDTVPCALFRSFERLLRRQEDKERTAVFVDVGSKFTTVVFGRSAEVSFIKQIPIGGDRFNREIAAKLGIGVGEATMLRSKLRAERNANADIPGVLQPEQNEVGLDPSTRQVIVDAVGAVAEELAREISLCFRYYTVTFRGKRVERAIFAGGEAYEKILLDVLRRQLTVEIEVAQPLRGFDMSQQAGINFDSDRRGWLCEWAVAVGLGLKGWKKITENKPVEV
ncbi:MAG: pilus assembly protein PilM [Planctomycetota bacterium]